MSSEARDGQRAPVGGVRPHQVDRTPDTREHVLREGLTMALYITISLLALLVAVPEREFSTTVVVFGVWGTALGLTLAHVFAFRATARLVSPDGLGHEDRSATLAIFVAAVAVAAVTSLPFLVTHGTSAVSWSRLLLAGFVGVVAWATARRQGGSMLRASLYTGGVVLVAFAAALTKNYLVGH